MNIAIDCTFFGHEEARSKKLSLSTSIFTADILDAFVKMGLSDNFTLFVNYNHTSFFQERFPQYKLKIRKLEAQNAGIQGSLKFRLSKIKKYIIIP